MVKKLSRNLNTAIVESMRCDHSIMIKRIVSVTAPTFCWSLFSAFILIGCMRPQPSTPLDVEPVIVIEIPSMSSDSTLRSDTMSFVLTGNSDYSLFRYRLDGGLWSEFSQGGRFRLEMLDEGTHELEIESRYEGHSDVSSRTVTFYVRAFDSAAVYLKPQLVLIGKTADTVTLNIGVKGLAACDRIHFSFKGAVVDSVWLPKSRFADSLFLFSSGNTADLLARPGVLPFEVADTAISLRVKVDKKTDSTRVDFSCIARDTANVDIKIRDTRGCLIIRK